MTIKLGQRTITALVIAVAIAIVVLLMPRSTDNKMSYEPNRPWTHTLLTAQFDVPVYRTPDSARAMRDSIERGFTPYYIIDNTVHDRIDSALAAAAGLTDGQRRRLRRVVDGVYRDGVVAAAVADSTPDAMDYEVIMVRDPDGDDIYERRETAAMRTQRTAYLYIDSVIADNDARHAIQSIGLAGLIEPNVILDSEENDRRHETAMAGANVAIGVIQKGERIIDRGDLVTPQLNTILNTYEQMLAERDTDRAARDVWMLVGQLLFVMAVFAGLVSYLHFFQRNVLGNIRYLTAIVALIVGFYILAVIMTRAVPGGLYIMPFCIVPIVLTVFFDGRTALFVHVATLMLCLPLVSFVMEFLVVELAAGVVLVCALRELSRRSQLIRASGFVFISYFFAYMAVELMISGSVAAITWRLVAYFAISTVLTSFAYLLIFIFEKIFGLISIVTLVELSDINNPVLLRLSEECPGTFQHSMGVSNLASTAATRLGANVQLVRAGALYHDIGKIKNPAFFTENQYGVNPHDALTPQQSARIIVNHVTDGIRMAEHEKLPSAVKDMILQHHGRGLAKYFYTTECRRHPDINVDPAPYSYPGPNPQTREASILMMADAVEAASRSLKEHSVEVIAELVNRIIDSQVADGLHAESPISFRDIKLIKESFINRLRSMYHARISYPPDLKRPASAPAGPQPAK